MNSLIGSVKKNIWRLFSITCNRIMQQFQDENTISKEIEMTKALIKRAPNNESAWNYLEGILLEVQIAHYTTFVHCSTFSEFQEYWTILRDKLLKHFCSLYNYCLSSFFYCVSSLEGHNLTTGFVWVLWKLIWRNETSILYSFYGRLPYRRDRKEKWSTGTSFWMLFRYNLYTGF